MSELLEDLETIVSEHPLAFFFSFFFFFPFLAVWKIADIIVWIFGG